MKKFLVVCLVALSLVGAYAIATHSWRSEQRQWEQALENARDRSRAAAKAELENLLEELE